MSYVSKLMKVVEKKAKLQVLEGLTSFVIKKGIHDFETEPGTCGIILREIDRQKKELEE